MRDGKREGRVFDVSHKTPDKSVSAEKSDTPLFSKIKCV
jgi:hypothetical protein